MYNRHKSVDLPVAMKFLNDRFKKSWEFVQKYEFLIPLALGLVFFRLTLIQVSWGLPDIWNPDELIDRVVHALQGRWVFDQINFDYPSLPKYAMFWLGKLLLNWGFSYEQVIYYARVLSILLGSFTVILTYRIARLIGAAILPSAFAALLLIANSELSINARFAHNDIYLTFFVTLVVFAVVKYSLASRRQWIYLAGLFSGFAASSKYNGATILLLPVLYFVYLEWREKRTLKWNVAKPLLVICVLSGVGYAIGTPRSVLVPIFYFENLLPALANHPIRARGPDSLVGLLGQWGAINRSIGAPIFLLFLVSALGLLWYFLRRAHREAKGPSIELESVAILFVAMIAFDLPILVSYYYPYRLFMPLYPLMAVASAAFLHLFSPRLFPVRQPVAKTLSVIVLLLVFSLSMLRVAGIVLLLKNDPRYNATQLLLTLPKGKLEYTLYPPNIPRENFFSATAYPIRISKFLLAGEAADTQHGFNLGSAGVEVRQPDYLIVDSFTYNVFNDALACENYAAECAFFDSLLAGRSAYEQIGSFSYELPWYIPEQQASFLNPVILVFQRE